MLELVGKEYVHQKFLLPIENINTMIDSGNATMTTTGCGSTQGLSVPSIVSENKNDSNPLQATIMPNVGTTVLSEEIEYINYIKPKSAVQEEELIKIHDLPLNYKILRSLTDDRAWLEGDVVSAYIYDTT